MYCRDCASLVKRCLSTGMIRLMLLLGYLGNVPLLRRITKHVANTAREKLGVIRVLPYEEMVDFINNAERSCVFFASAKPGKCRCRSAGFHHNKETNLPCVDYGPIEDIVSIVRGGRIRILHQEEALGIVHEAKEKSMVHTITAYKEREEKKHGMLSVCSCCGCCCVGIVPYRHGVDEACDSSGKIAVTDGNCIGCNACVTHCKKYFNARKLIEKDGRMVAVSTDRCIGCGTCRFVCPENSISLVPREEVIGDVSSVAEGIAVVAES